MRIKLITPKARVVRLFPVVGLGDTEASDPVGCAEEVPGIGGNPAAAVDTGRTVVVPVVG